jgi:single-stranded-DNA-specific exonuclease
VIAEPHPTLAQRLAIDLGVAPLTGQLLINRGIQTSEEGRRFLSPELDHLIDPFKLPNMPAAVERIQQALQRHERIAIFGDYDVDGITATCVLTMFLRLLGNEPLYHIPHRIRGGYGLSRAFIEECKEQGVGLIVTLDCGTYSVEEVALARKLGIDVVVVDHHEPPETLPEAVALVNPKLADSQYPFKGLCSSALSFKLAWALAEKMPALWKQSDAYRVFLINGMSLAALGTIADVTPLRDENRVIVLYGMSVMPKASNKALRKLLEQTRLSKVTPFDVSFKLAPRLNALGRMAEASDVARFFLSQDDQEVEQLMQSIEKANKLRQETEQEVTKEAIEKAEHATGPVIVVYRKSWHPGVVGIVAARLVERFHKPAIVMSDIGEHVRGSGRSIEGFSLKDAILACRDVILQGGGHEAAVGVTLEKSKLNDFMDRINAYAAGRINGAARPLRMDAEVALREVTPALCQEVGRLAPFGFGNAEPLLAARNVRVAGETRIMKERHISFYVEDGRTSRRVIAFGMSGRNQELRSGAPLDIAFAPQASSFTEEGVELVAKELLIRSA